MHKKYTNIIPECISNPLTRMSSFSFHLGNVLLLNANHSGGDYYSDQCFFGVQPTKARVSLKLC